MSGRPLALVVLLVPALVLAGCASPTPAAEVAPDAAAPVGPGPQAVVALIDTGINPYHVDFRDHSPLARVHPSEYLPGYPAEAVAVNLTLDAEDLDAALKADKALWKALKPGVVYWFVGTKVSGYAPDGSYEDPDVGIVFSTGHGTMTASRAAGNEYSLCPECRIVAVQGFTSEAVSWAAGQPWIDVQSNSWSPFLVFQQADGVPLLGGDAGLTDAFEAAAMRHAVFGSAGNGVGGKGGLLGHPSFTRSTSGPRGVVSVGGHDNGEVILWSGSWPHVAADACDNWAAVGDSLDEYDPKEGGGTSSASPYAAGEAARIVLEARRILGVHEPVQDGILVGATGGALMVDLGESPMQDGQLSVEDLRTLLMKTAVAKPVRTEHDGDRCATASPYGTYPIEWSSLPDSAPRYPLIGYGQISVDSLAQALAVLRGEAPMPARAEDDAWHARAETLRETYNGLPP